MLVSLINSPPKGGVQIVQFEDPNTQHSTFNFQWKTGDLS